MVATRRLVNETLNAPHTAPAEVDTVDEYEPEGKIVAGSGR
jgi:hypothetical protein